MSQLLTSRVLSPSELNDQNFSEMYSLFSDYFHSKEDIFQKDLFRKDWIILLEKKGSKSIKGFTSIGCLDLVQKGKEMSAVYSGDTIIDKNYWKTFELSKRWIQTVLEKCKHPHRPLYWLLLSSGYRTYRFLPTFYKEYYPRYDQETPKKFRNIMNVLAKEIYGASYHKKTGVVQFKRGSSPLLEDMAKVDPGRLKDQHVAFFLEKNPGYVNGDELVCLTEIRNGNYTPAGERMLLR